MGGSVIVVFDKFDFVWDVFFNFIFVSYHVFAELEQIPSIQY